MAESNEYLVSYSQVSDCDDAKRREGARPDARIWRAREVSSRFEIKKSDYQISDFSYK